MASDVGKQATNLQPALAVFGKGKWRLHQVPDGSAVGTDRRIALIGGVVEFGEGGLGIQRVPLGGGAIHVQENELFGLCGQLSLPLRHSVLWVVRLVAGSRE